MGQALGQVLSFGVGVALSPAATIAVVLMLATPNGRVNGPAFLAGWMSGVTGAVTIALLAATGADARSGGAPADWVSVVKVVLGVLLLAVAVHEWRGRPRGEATPELPSWMHKVDAFDAPRAAGIALLLTIAPKNLLVIVGAATAIAQTGVGAASQAVAVAVFVVIGSVGVAAPVAVYFLGGDRADKILGDLRDWMARENAVIMALLCLIISAKLIGDAVTGLTT